MEVRAVGKGEVQIRGVDSGLFLAMSSKGKLYGEVTPRMAGGEDEGCRELERNDKGRNGCVCKCVCLECASLKKRKEKETRQFIYVA